MNKCESEKARKFERSLKNSHIDINTFLKLFNEWTEMTNKERGECIKKCIW